MFALISSRSGSQSAIILRRALQGHHGLLVSLLELSPLLVFEFYFLSLLCNTNTLRNILMMLGTNVEQDEMTFCIQE